MKFDIKKILRIAFTLMLVAGISGVLIVLLNNYVTADIIAQNEVDKENKALSEIYSDSEYEVIGENVSDTILKVTKATKDSNLAGYIYKVTGKNSYGSITIMLGINNGVVTKLILTENTESFKTTVDDYVVEKYPDNQVSSSNIDDIDTKCGATYGAKLVKSLVQAALSHYNENYGGNE